MSQCVPSWDLDENPKLTLSSHSNSFSLTPDVPTSDYEVAELTWENGQLSMHGLGPPRVPTKSQAAPSPNKYTWDKPRAAGGTLESIVDQATFFPHYKSTMDSGYGTGDATTDDLVPWFNNHRTIIAPTSTTASTTVMMDALVPCTNNNINEGASIHVMDSGVGTRVESCSRTASVEKGRVARAAAGAAVAQEWSSCRDKSVTGSATFGRDSRQVTLDTCEKEFGMGMFTSTSLGSPGNTSSGEQCTADDHDSVCHSRRQRVVGHEEAKKKINGKSSISTKRSRAAAVHNQSERKRRDKINQRMKTLQKMVPNSSKTDKASMLDEVIEYLKQLQGQVNMMSRMNMSPMMLPLAMQQQLQMSMMAPMMGMGMGMGMGMNVMDMNAMAGRPNMAGMPPVLHPSVFMAPLTSWDGTGDRLHTPASVMPDPMSAFLAACQSQPMTMDAYSRMAALYQQLNQNPGPGAKN